MHNLMMTFLVVTLFLATWTAMAGPQVGTITAVDGNAEIYSHPGRLEDGPKPRGKYKGKFYTVKQAKVGDRIQKGYILRTLANGKMRIVYDNGDQLNLAAGSQAKVIWKKDTQDGTKSEAEIKLYRGLMRAVVSKKGPRRRLKVRTRGVVMGVRGTDFVVENRMGKKPVVGVLRGRVEVRNRDRWMGEVLTGNHGRVESDRVAILKMGKSQLVEFHRETYVKSVKAQRSPSGEKQGTIAKLEKIAIDATLDDVKAVNPKHFAELSAGNIQNSQQIHTQVVKKLFRKAPRYGGTTKAHENELEDLDKDVYRKFYKIR